MAVYALDRMGKLKRSAQRSFRAFHTGPVCLVDDEHIRDLQYPCFDGLDFIAETGRFHYHRGMREASNVHLALTRADRFDNDNIESGGIEDRVIEDVACAIPPNDPRVAMERMKMPLSPARSRMRMRSPSTAPPVNGLDGSTARMAIRFRISDVLR